MHAFSQTGFPQQREQVRKEIRRRSGARCTMSNYTLVYKHTASISPFAARAPQGHVRSRLLGWRVLTIFPEVTLSLAPDLISGWTRDFLKVWFNVHPVEMPRHRSLSGTDDVQESSHRRE